MGQADGTVGSTHCSQASGHSLPSGGRQGAGKSPPEAVRLSGGGLCPGVTAAGKGHHIPETPELDLTFKGASAPIPRNIASVRLAGPHSGVSSGDTILFAIFDVISLINYCL